MRKKYWIIEDDCGRACNAVNGTAKEATQTLHSLQRFIWDNGHTATLTMRQISRAEHDEFWVKNKPGGVLIADKDDGALQ